MKIHWITKKCVFSLFYSSHIKQWIFTTCYIQCFWKNTVLRGQAPVSFSSQARGARSKQGGLEPSQAEAMSPKMHHRESNLRAQREQISNSNTKQPCHLPARKSHLHRNLIQNCFGDWFSDYVFSLNKFQNENTDLNTLQKNHEKNVIWKNHEKTVIWNTIKNNVKINKQVRETLLFEGVNKSLSPNACCTCQYSNDNDQSW